MSEDRFLGVFMNPICALYEGVEQVFDNLERAGVRGIVTHPTIARPAPNGKGGRFPPLHEDGYNRVLGRALWDKRELFVQGYRAFEPNMALYEQTSYKPRGKAAPADLDSALPAKILAEAKKRGMEAHIHASPYGVPGLRREDKAVRVDGALPEEPMVSAPACLNSPDATAYGLAVLEDTVTHYPDADGLFMDWVEWGAYRIEGYFTCFCEHCANKAKAQGIDWNAVTTDVRRLWDWLHALTPRELERSRRVARNASELVELLAAYPGWLTFLKFKADTVASFYRETRALLDRLGKKDMQLSARGWPPPWNRASGMDYRQVSDVCDTVTPKLFTFDYCAMPRWWGQLLQKWNPDLSESGLLDAMVDWMDLPDDIERRSFAHYNIPAPGVPHPARLECYRTRLDEVAAQVEGRARLRPFAHAYLPEPQWKQMVALIRDSRCDGMWVQMYGYLSAAKLDVLRRVWRC